MSLNSDGSLRPHSLSPNKKTIQELESETRRQSEDNKYLRSSLNYLLNNLKNYIDNSSNSLSALQKIYEEAYLLQEQIEEQDQDSNKRREKLYNEIKPQMEGENGVFTLVTLDNYSQSHKSSNHPINTVSRIPTLEEKKESRNEKFYHKKDQSSQGRASFKSSFDDSNLRFLKRLKSTAVGLCLESHGNILVPNNEPVLQINRTKQHKMTQIHSNLRNSQDNNLANNIIFQSNLLKKASSTNTEFKTNKNNEQELFDHFVESENEFEESPLPPMKNKEKKQLKNETFATKLFENFVVIGADPNEIKSTDENEFKNARFCPKILYDFDSAKGKSEDINFNEENEKQDFKPFYEVLPNFCFPFGVPLKRINSDKRNKILTRNYDKKDENDREKFFIVTINSDHSYNKNFGSPLLENINPQHILYCICISTEDYMKKENFFWMTPKIYSFLTYYPFPKLFLKLFLEITKELKALKLEKSFIDESQSGGFTDKIIEILQNEMNDSFVKLASYAIPKTNITPIILELKFKYSNEDLVFRIPKDDLLGFQSYLWCCPMVFSNIPFEDFRFLLYALMLENHIAFVSSNLTLLTSTVLTFFNIMKPIRWIDPMVISLNESMLPYIDAPSPILLGINASKNRFNNYNDLFSRSECLFYLLDENQVMIFPGNENRIQQIQKMYPTFQDIKHELRDIYKPYFNKMASSQFQNILSKFSHHEKRLIRKPTKEQKQKAKELLMIIRNRIEINFIQHLPKEPIYLQKDELDIDKIKKIIISKTNDKRNEEFLHNFLQTQNVIYFIQTYYESQKKND